MEVQCFGIFFILSLLCAVDLWFPYARKWHFIDVKTKIIFIDSSLCLSLCFCQSRYKEKFWISIDYMSLNVGTHVQQNCRSLQSKFSWRTRRQCHFGGKHIFRNKADYNIDFGIDSSIKAIFGYKNLSVYLDSLNAHLVRTLSVSYKKLIL